MCRDAKGKSERASGIMSCSTDAEMVRCAALLLTSLKNVLQVSHVVFMKEYFIILYYFIIVNATF